MSKQIWSDGDVLIAALRQLAIENGTPNVMPTFAQMQKIPGLANWVKKKEGGVNKLSKKLNLVVKSPAFPMAEARVTHNVLKGEIVYVQTTSNVHPAIVIDKSKEPGSLIVCVLNKKLSRKHVVYGNTPTSKYQWCYAKDIPSDLIKITT